jgi:hypothetical protein
LEDLLPVTRMDVKAATEAENEGDGGHDEGGDNNHHVLNHEYQY